MSASISKSKQPSAIIPDHASQDHASGYPEPLATLLAMAQPGTLSGEGLLATQAIGLLIRLDRELLEARAQWNQDWFRRIMHARSKAVSRLVRRWGKVIPLPAMPLGSLRRRYHSNLTR